MYMHLYKTILKDTEMKVRIISILIISFLASSCSLLRYRSLEEEYNKVWTGRSYAEIVEEFGHLTESCLTVKTAA